MAVDVAVPAAHLRARALALPVRGVLAGMIAVSFAIRWLLASAHETPYYFPDEYLYPTLAHGIATTGAPSVRGEGASFPALLEPLLTAPFWLAGDVDLAYALTQGLHALAMSLAAIPVFVLARKLGLDARWSIGAAALALAAPALSYAGFMLADPIAYPLVLAAVCAGVHALDRPSPRAQLAFLGFAGLATFARVQFVVLPALFLVAALAVEGRRTFRSYRLLLACLGVPLLAVAAVGLDRALGYYSVLGESELPLGDLLRWLGSDAMVVAYASGWLIVPGGLLGLAVGLLRPASRAERGFAALASLLALALIGQAAFYSANASDSVARVHERYTFVLVPLVGLAFLVYARRGFPWRGALAALAAAMLVLSMRLPLSGYTMAQGKDDSPTLRAVLRLENALGVANGSLAVAALAGVLALGAAALALRRRRGPALALGVTLVVLGGIAAGAVSFERANSRVVLADALPNGRDWVDRHDLGSVTLVQLPGADRHAAFEQLFWNRSIDRLVLTGSGPIDAFAATGAAIGDDGRLLAGAQPVTGPLLLQTWGAHVELSGVERVARTRAFELVRPAGTPRIEVLAPGFHGDGWVARNAAVTVWPDARGRTEGELTLLLSLPEHAKRTRLDLSGPGLQRRVVVEPGRRTEVVLSVSRRGPWTVE
nr:hypothetical protein [Actinomycetota bacterium]